MMDQQDRVQPTPEAKYSEDPECNSSLINELCEFLETDPADLEYAEYEAIKNDLISRLRHALSLSAASGGEVEELKDAVRVLYAAITAIGIAHGARNEAIMRHCQQAMDKTKAVFKYMNKASLAAAPGHEMMVDEVSLARTKKYNPELFENDLGTPEFPRKENPEPGQEG